MKAAILNPPEWFTIEQKVSYELETLIASGENEAMVFAESLGRLRHSVDSPDSRFRVEDDHGVSEECRFHFGRQEFRQSLRLGR